MNEDNQNLDKAAVSTAAVPHAHLNDKYKEVSEKYKTTLSSLSSQCKNALSKVVTTFVTADHGIMEKDRSAVTSETATLIGVSMPFYYYFKVFWC